MLQAILYLCVTNTQRRKIATPDSTSIAVRLVLNLSSLWGSSFYVPPPPLLGTSHGPWRPETCYGTPSKTNPSAQKKTQNPILKTNFVFLRELENHNLSSITHHGKTNFLLRPVSEPTNFNPSPHPGNDISLPARVSAARKFGPGPPSWKRNFVSGPIGKAVLSFSKIRNVGNATFQLYY